MPKETVQRNATARVLVIDDDLVFLHALQRILAQNGYQVQTATSTAEALAHVEAEPVDLLISDFYFPETDALHLLRELRKRDDSTPVIVLTAGGGVESYLEVMNCGAFEYLTKPVKDVELLALVRKALDSQAQHSSSHSHLSEEPSPWR